MAEKKGSKELLAMLNDAVARELQVSVQYMWQHVQAKGFKGKVVSDEFKEIAIEEMKHAEEIAERLVALGGVPTTKPTAIEVGASTKEMLELDIKSENEAIALYKEIIALAKKLDDIATRRLFEKILVEEMDHLQTFEDYTQD